MKFIRRDYTSANTPSTYAEVQDFMCSEIADMIVSTDTGWEYDERTPNKTAFISLPNPGGTSSYPQTRYPILYLRNTISGAKLAVVSIITTNEQLNMTAASYTSSYAPSAVDFLFMRSGDEHSCNVPSGIGIAMIPPDIEGEFPDAFPSVFPNGTIRFICEFPGFDYSTTQQYSNYAGYVNGSIGNFLISGFVVSYGLLVDSERLFLMSANSTGSRSSLDLVFGIGRLIGALSYDSELQSQYYAGIRFCTKGNTYTQYANMGKEEYFYYGYGPYQSINPSSYDKNYTPFRFMVESLKQDGTIFSGRYTVLGQDVFASNITTSEQTDVIRWQPGFVFKVNDVLYENGDGFKGYLDTNLIRYAIANIGQLFNDGQFCCVATNLLLKWDPDAEDTILA